MGWGGVGCAGGHRQIGVAGGGTDFVPFFAARGVSCVVLRPRLRIDGYNMTTDAVYDTQQAVRIVRSRAAEWRIDPRKIGVVGFSAGAELTAAAALEYDAFDAAHKGDDLGPFSSRPDFVGLIYPVSAATASARPPMRSQHPELARPPKRCLGARVTVSWPWVAAWGSLEPPRRDGENAQNTG